VDIAVLKEKYFVPIPWLVESERNREASKGFETVRVSPRTMRPVVTS
jgi:hypothetical protein